MVYLSSFRICEDMSEALRYAAHTAISELTRSHIHFHRHDDGKVSVSRLQETPLYAGQQEFRP